MHSIDQGAISRSRLCEDLTRNASVVSVYALKKNVYCRIGFFVTPKSRDFHENLNFLESGQDASWKLVGCVGRALECLRISRNDFRLLKK